MVACGTGCAFTLARPYPRADRCNTLLTPILDGAGVALFTTVAIASSNARIRADCPVDDPDCYRTVANRQSDVRAYGSIAAVYAGSAAWGLWSRSRCQQALASSPPPVIPTVAEPVRPPPGGGFEPAPAPLRPPGAPAQAAAEPAEPTATEAPATEPSTRGRRGRAYTSVWIGSGGGVVTRPGADVEFLQLLLVPLPLSAGLGLGAPVSSRLLLGGEWNVTLAFNCAAGMDSASGPCDRTVVLQQLVATATYFPRWSGAPEAPPAGWFVRGGPALALLNSHYTDLVSPDGAITPEQRARWRRIGGGLLVGTGLSVHAASHLSWTFDGGLDLAWHRYGSSATEPTGSFETLLHLGVTFH